MNVAHLVGELEGEAAVELCECGGQVELCERLADAVPAAHAERHEAHRRAAVHLRRTLHILRAFLQHRISPSSVRHQSWFH